MILIENIDEAKLLIDLIFPNFDKKNEKIFFHKIKYYFSIIFKLISYHNRENFFDLIIKTRFFEKKKNVYNFWIQNCKYQKYENIIESI